MSYKFYYNGEYSLLGVTESSPMWNMGASRYCWRQGGVTYRCPGATTRGTSVQIGQVTNSSGTSKTVYYINNSAPTICWRNGSTYYGARGSSSQGAIKVFNSGSYRAMDVYNTLSNCVSNGSSRQLFPSVSAITYNSSKTENSAISYIHVDSIGLQYQTSTAGNAGAVYCHTILFYQSGNMSKVSVILESQSNHDKWCSWGKTYIYFGEDVYFK